MASIQTRKETGTLIIDFYYQGQRCREQTALPDTPANRKRLGKLLDRIEADLAAGTFDYGAYFPNSKRAVRIAERPFNQATTTLAQALAGQEVPIAGNETLIRLNATPLLKDFAETWYREKEVEWRRTHKIRVRDLIDRVLIPQFGDQAVGRITKADILGYRAQLAKVPARSQQPLSNWSINKTLGVLRQILGEAADRFDFRTPFNGINPLKIKKVDVDPFTLDEVRRIIATCREDYRAYFTVRFFTGMRTAEVHGLKWKYVDFERRLILVRETFLLGEDEYTKTDASQRDIQMSQAVYDALMQQKRVTHARSEYVFCNKAGQPIENRNFIDRVWAPLLNLLGIKVRRPYQCRHTAATLWLAAGEAPEWIARQLGHTTTEMLFRIYSRYVPNLTRQDGSAFDRLLIQSGAADSVIENPLATIAERMRASTAARTRAPHSVTAATAQVNPATSSQTGEVVEVADGAEDDDAGDAAEAAPVEPSTGAPPEAAARSAGDQASKPPARKKRRRSPWWQVPASVPVNVDSGSGGNTRQAQSVPIWAEVRHA